MKYLSQGLESKKKLELLISLTKITSESITGGIMDHYLMNFSVSDAASLNGCKRPNLVEAIDKLNSVAKTVELINELNYK